MKSVMFLFLALILFSSYVSASLGITPALEVIDFKPGEVREFSFTAYSDNSDKEIEIYLDGDLKEHASVSKKSSKGAVTFKVTINFPEFIEIPGQHNLYVRAREAPPEEDFIGTRIDIGALIKIFVPYPGKYLEMSLDVPDINVGEEALVSVKLSNKGRENLDINKIYTDFSTNGEKVFNLPFSPIFLNVSQDKSLKKILDTSSFKAGNYFAELVADYGEIKSVNKTFRIGSLFVDIINFTDSVKKGGIEKFYIGVESGWNGKIENVFAEVNISDSLNGDFVFRTPSVDLGSFEQKTIESFFDTNEVEVGEHEMKIILNYRGERTIVDGILRVYEVNYILIGVIVGAIILIAAAIIFINWKRNKKKRK